MTTLADKSSKASSERLAFLVHLALSAISIAQPLFSVTGTNLNFFVAWRMTGIEFAGWILLIYAVPPLITYLLVSLGYRLHRYLGRALEFAVFWLYISIAGAIAQIVSVGVFLPILSALLAALLLSKPAMRGVVGLLGVLTVIFPALMLYRGYELGVILPSPVPPPEKIQSASPPNVVLIVYDELPLTTILDADGLIDRQKFPNFHALAQDSTWLANVRSVSGETETAVPAILSGRLAKTDVPATYKNYPENIFYTLGPSYNVLDLQIVTNLNPFAQSGVEAKAPFVERSREIATDIAIIYAHLAAPPSFAAELPPINRQLNHFGEDDATTSPHDLPQHQKFIAALKNAKPPFLAVYHNVYPHNMWSHYPSGTSYPPSRWGDYISLADRENARLGVDDTRIRHDYQAHLFQSMHADKLLGELLDQLKRSGTYDRSMIVVVADHGVTLWPGEKPRSPNVSHNPDVFAVPLFVKLPEQKHPLVSMDRVHTIDVYPTILDYLGLAKPADVEGKSFLESLRQAQPAETVKSTSYLADPTLKRRIRWFGTGVSSADLYGFEEFRNYIGHSVNEFSFTRLPNTVVKLLGPEGVRRTPFADSARIDAEIVGGRQDGEVRSIVVALGDRFCGATRTTDLKESGVANSFTLILAEECLRVARKRELRVFVLDPLTGLAEAPIDTIPTGRVVQSLAELIGGLKTIEPDEPGEITLTELRKRGVTVPDLFAGEHELMGPWGDLNIVANGHGWLIDFYSAPEKDCANLLVGASRMPGVIRVAPSALAKDEMIVPVTAEQAKQACAKADAGFVRVTVTSEPPASTPDSKQGPSSSQVIDEFTQLVDALVHALAAVQGNVELSRLRELAIPMPPMFAAGDKLSWPWGSVAIQKDGARWILDLYSAPEAVCRAMLLSRIPGVTRVAATALAKDEMAIPVTTAQARQVCAIASADSLRFILTNEPHESEPQSAQTPSPSQVMSELTRLIDALVSAPVAVQGNLELSKLREQAIAVPGMFTAGGELSWPWGNVAIQKEGMRWTIDLHSAPGAVCKAILLGVSQTPNVARVATSSVATDEIRPPVAPDDVEQRCARPQVDVVRIVTTDEPRRATAN